MNALAWIACPKCGARMQTARRGGHAPCVACAVEGRGVVQMRAEKPEPASHLEPVEKEAAPAGPPRVVLLGEIDDRPVTRDCEKDGHVYSGRDACGYCEHAYPDDPASGYVAGCACKWCSGVRSRLLLSVAAVVFVFIGWLAS